MINTRNIHPLKCWSAQFCQTKVSLKNSGVKKYNRSLREFLVKGRTGVVSVLELRQKCTKGTGFPHKYHELSSCSSV